MLPTGALTTLQRIVGEANASNANSVRQHHSQDQSSHLASLPDVVVWPGDATEVSAVVRYASEFQIPITGWGAGSSLEGNPIPTRGGIVIDFGRMNRILAIHREDFQVTVQPGVLYKDMNKELARDGLFFAPDPGANASIGGMIANNAAGTRTPKYGATRDNVMALEAVLANGDVIRTGSRSVKQSAGYDLTHLFIGSEGTLGLITEATLKLAPIPEHFSTGIASFPATKAAAQAVFEIIGAGLNPAALELLDTATIEAINKADKFQLAAVPNLFLEFHGASEASLGVELELVSAICSDCGCLSFEAGIGREVRDRLWESRHRLGELLIQSYPGQRYLITDVAVPISNYPDLVEAASNALQNLDQVKGFIFGHAGDGNMHSMIFFDDDDATYSLVERQFNDRVVAKAVALEGTSTGEHGVGIGKRKYMVNEHGEGAVEVMRQIKRLLDPQGIFNPGKVLP